jgi:hypothetical protein
MSNSFGNHPNVDIYYFLRRRAMGVERNFYPSIDNCWSVWQTTDNRQHNRRQVYCFLHSRPSVAVPQLCGTNAGPAKVQSVARLCICQDDDAIVELRLDGNRIQNSRPSGLSQSALGSLVVRTLVRCHESI